jgi:D-3-phosphoglycerate dehydrogenase
MQSMARILVTEAIAESGLQRLLGAGHAVDVQLGLSRSELLAAVEGAEALIIRSATTVDSELLAAAERLLVVGRAGIGLDNVDLDAATARGVMVVNAPESNVISAAEHTMALLLAQARNVPQAHAASGRGSSSPTRRSASSAWDGSASSSPTGPAASACASSPSTRTSRRSGRVLAGSS